MKISVQKLRSKKKLYEPFFYLESMGYFSDVYLNILQGYIIP